MKNLFLLAAIATVATGSASASTSFDDDRSELVRFADLDLGSERGARLLDRRIAVAATALCGPMSDVDLAGKKIIRRCREAVIAGTSADRVMPMTQTQGTPPGYFRLILQRP
jgi:UrcA family protein